MKKLLSIILSMVMLITTVASVNISAFAASTISLGEKQRLTLAEGEITKVHFKPTEDGVYYLYSTGDYDTACDLYDDLGEIYYCFDDESDLNFVATCSFRAGRTYCFEISTYEEQTVSFDIILSTKAPENYEPDYEGQLINRIEFTPAKEITYYQGVPDFIGTDENDEPIDVYDPSTQLFCDGNVLTVFYADGDVVNYTSKIVSITDEDFDLDIDTLEYVPDNSDYESISYYDIYISEFQGNDLETGTYSVDVFYLNTKTQLQFKIIENPVVSIEYTSNNALKEGVDNIVNINDDGEAEDWYFYYPMEGDTLKVNYNDGTGAVFTAVVCTCEEYADDEAMFDPIHMVSEDGIIIHEGDDFIIGSDAEIIENNHGVGINETVCTYMGRTSDFEFVIEPTDIESIEVTAAKTTLVLGKDNAKWASPYIYFECPEFTTKVTYKNGEVKEYSYDELMKSKDISIAVYDDQISDLFDYNPWLPGQQHQFIVYCTADLYDTIDVKITGKCPHEVTDYFGFYEATCTEDGYSGDECCVACGEYIGDGYIIPMVSNFKLDTTVLTYNGSVQTPKLTVKDRTGALLVEGEDYEVYYPNSINTGKYEIEVELIGDYYDTKTVSYSIKPRTAVISSVTPAANGFTINWGKRPESTGYQIQYATKADFSNAATIYGGATDVTSKTITGRAAGTKYYVRVRTYKNIGNNNYLWGNWSYSKAVTTPSKPAATSITSLSGVKNGFTIKWNKVSATTGYQIQYATKKDFSNAATVYGGPTNTTSKTITGRAAKTKYYIRVRTYKNIGGKYVWGGWSAAKTVITK